MTAHPIDTEALRKQHAHLVEKYGPGAWAESRARVVLALLDALAAAEHRATRAEAQSAIRGRAVVMYRERAREAEERIRDLTQEVRDERGAALDLIEQVKIRDARIKAVRELHSGVTPHDECEHSRMHATCPTTRALDGDA